MKNIKTIIIGIALTLITVLFINGIFQYLLALIFETDIEKFKFSIYGLSPVIFIDNDSNIYTNTFLLLSPVLLNFLFMEISLLFLKQSKLDKLRYSVITFLILLIGYFILTTFYSMIELVISLNNNSLWVKLVHLWQLEGNQIYVLIAFVILVVITYLQLTQKRLMQHIVV